MIHYWGNIIEGVFWIAIAGGMYGGSRGANERLKPIAHRAAIAFICFGITDFIEVRTGSWYDPLWLLLLKAACVIVLLHCLIQYYRRRRELPEQQPESC